ncbi:MEMO1 family [Filobasidium floriforme]|uniref:MEMO1 family n=1 Tax=Filobasidium floriforme TaxID=5210 RepID=UPI001E8E58CC|nr:MEMO1 family [Filobasidium floriforme]KAH8086820.1 MEMO1 family [Filobasidium floriforme]
MSTRSATHAGSWYSNNPATLRAQLEKNLSAVKPIPELDFDPPIQKCKALIGPHAGYSYSAPAAAWAYAAIPTESIKRVFLLGPSHHYHLDKIALSQHHKYGTPLGDIPLDLDVIKDLEHTELFDKLDKEADEDEHSLEMHLPYIRHVFSNRPDLKLIPLLVGSVSPTKVDAYAEVLAEYWKDPGTFWVISTDFCHWGTRFSHTPYYPSPPSIANPVPPVPSPSSSPSTSKSAPELVTLSKHNVAEKLSTPIWESIQYMDHEAIEILRGAGKEGTGKKFREYLRRTGNTICGRNPVIQLLSMLEHLSATTHSSSSSESGSPFEIKFVRYEQSSRCETLRDSSVSYVSGLVLERE